MKKVLSAMPDCSPTSTLGGPGANTKHCIKGKTFKEFPYRMTRHLHIDLTSGYQNNDPKQSINCSDLYPFVYSQFSNYLKRPTSVT